MRTFLSALLSCSLLALGTTARAGQPLPIDTTYPVGPRPPPTRPTPSTTSLPSLPPIDETLPPSSPSTTLTPAPLVPTATAVPSAPPAPALPPPGELPSIPSDPAHKLEVDIHGHLLLWFYQPLAQLDPPRLGDAPLGPDDRFFEVALASVGVSGKYGGFGVYVNPRFRDTKSREFFNSNVWLQQAYASYETPYFKISAGKIENQLSVLDDDSFYLNLPYFDGIKYESDYGLSIEGTYSKSDTFSVHYTGQYFVTDGKTNGSLRDRDTVWVEGGHRRHIAVLRAEPSIRFSPTASLRTGVALEAFTVDLGSGSNDPVLRAEADVSFVTGPVRLFSELVLQLGKTVTQYPLEAKGNLPAHASAINYYLVAGGGVRIWRFYPRYNVSLAQYADVGITEMIHVPGVTFLAHENMSLQLEYGYWPRYNPTRTLLFDNSLNFVILGKF